MNTKVKKIAAPIDYEGLRREVLEYISEYSSDTWTDYNTHDPGITIAEILCFALTELGLRANLPIEDLIAKQMNSGQAGFFPADEILTNMPLTENDYRKLLIDMDGVKNAWLTEIEGHHSPVYVDTFNNKLTLMSEPESCYYRTCRVVTCEFDGDSNTEAVAAIEARFKGKAVLLTRIDYQALFDRYVPLKKLTFEFQSESMVVERDVASGFAVHQNNLYSRQKFDEMFGNKLFNEVSVQTDRALDEHESEALAALVESLNPANMDPLDGGLLNLFRTHEYIKSIRFTSPFEVTRAGITQHAWLNVFLDVNGALCMSSYDDNTLACRGYYRVDVELDNGFPKERYDDKLADIRSKLNRNRNLCELFPEINIVDDEYVCVCFDIEVTSQADVEAVLSDAVYRLDRFISPEIHSYSLKQMLDKSYTTEEIFNGPLLEHGFIDDNELEAALPRETLYASDLIREIMDVEHVVAVKRLLMSSFHPDATGKLIPVEVDRSWSLSLDTGRSCKLLVHYKVGDYEYQSQIRAHKGVLPYCVCPTKLKHNIKVLRSRDLPLPFTMADLTYPSIDGHESALDEYQSIRNLFPMNYALKDGELPDSASNERKAKVLQLRAFLLFFDQLLANAFSQLSKVGDLLSFTPVERTYFTQSTESANTLKVLLNMTPEDYLNRIQTYSESRFLFEDRRNRFLDHLLARFAEEFNSYYALADHIYGDLSKSRLIRDKERILKNIVPWSSERFCAENLSISDTTPLNLSGLEHRLRVFLGMATREAGASAYRITTEGDIVTLTFEDADLSYLKASVSSALSALLEDAAACVMRDASHMTIEVARRDGKFLYKTTRGDNGIIFESPKLYDTAATAETAREACLEFFSHRAHFQTGLNQSNLLLKDSSESADFRFTLSNRQNEILVSNRFTGDAERRRAINWFYACLRELREVLDEQKEALVDALLDTASRIDLGDQTTLIAELEKLMSNSRILGVSEKKSRMKAFNVLLHKVVELDNRPISGAEKKERLLKYLSRLGTPAKADDQEKTKILDAIFQLICDTGKLAVDLKRVLMRSAVFRHLADSKRDMLIVGIIAVMQNKKLPLDQKRTSVETLLENAVKLSAEVSDETTGVQEITISGKISMTARKMQVGNRWSFSITVTGKYRLILESSKSFDTEKLAEIALYESVDFLLELDLFDKMYIIEHILLQLNNSVPEQTLPVHLDAAGDIVTGFDPYSFRMTIVLPGETEIMSDALFRQYFEKFIREATPSHLFPKICWVSNRQMLAFEKAYTNWRHAWAAYSRNEHSATQLDVARAELLDILNDLESIYEQAILGGGTCSCTGEDRPALVLGHTKLGSQNGD